MTDSIPSETITCGECGMPLPQAESQFVYHPYAACLMFKQCHDSTVVQANLDGVVAHGYQLAIEEGKGDE